MGLHLRRRLRHALFPLEAALNRYRARGPRPPRFCGAFANRAEALAALPVEQRAGYDDAEIAEVSFDDMCRVAHWDYPVLFWLQHHLKPGLHLVDAGGHMGTKYIAFSPFLDLSGITWTVQDLPGIVQAARAAQQAGRLPAEIGFEHDPDALPRPDVLLASGLLQYLDQPVEAFLAMHAAPCVLLNKVALREGPTLVTLETIGQARVPYQIRNRAEFEAALGTAGYAVRDRWDVPALGHRIATHPGLGTSQSRGYLLEKI